MINSEQFLKDFENIDTSRVKDISDLKLIEECRKSEIVNGWGQLAELLKRFKKCSQT